MHDIHLLLSRSDGLVATVEYKLAFTSALSMLGVSINAYSSMLQTDIETREQKTKLLHAS